MMMLKLPIFTVGLSSLLFTSSAIAIEQVKGNQDRMTECRIAVISDVHVMDPSLLVEGGKAFDDYLVHDRKMLRESTVILKEITDRLIAEHPQVVLLTGDLTKDGEYVSHRYLVDSCLVRLKKEGIQTLVIPGNHDVNDPHAVSFMGEKTERVRTVSAADFADIYADYGYGGALARDEHSLTYVYQPTTNLRILAIDACKYDENDFEKNICRHDGRIKPETMKFIKAQIADAHQKGIRIIAMMHHGLVSHWKYQDRIMKGYLVDDWKKQASELAAAGLEVVFTGHSHAQDISCRKKGKHTIYDVETGSSVTYPSPYRLVSIKDDSMEIKSRFLESIPMDLNGLSFAEYAKKTIAKGAETLVISAFPPNVPDSLKITAARCVGEALIANCCGDEKLSDEDRQKINELADLIKKYSVHCAKLFRIATSVLRDDVFPTDNDFTVQFAFSTAPLP
nr:metallophosphoesterase [uncultured Bacteroides sp.]